MKIQNFWKKLTLKNFKKTKFIASALLLGLTNSAFATTTSTIPFVQVMSKISDAISGPFALGVATVLIVCTGLMNAFGEFGDGAKKLVNVAFWMSIVFGVASMISTFGGTGSTF